MRTVFFRRLTNDAWAQWLGLGLFILGIVCRLHVYLLAFPIWRDEAALALNFVKRDYRGLLHALDNYQMAPLLFLWLEKAVYECLGGSTELLRLVPLVAGLMGLGLFWRLAWVSLSPIAAACSVGCLAVASSPVHLAATIKPYSLDLLFATLLLLLGFLCLRQPRRSTSLATLAVITPIAIAASYPAVFLAASVSMVLLPVLWTRGSRGERAWFIAYNLLYLAAFVAHLRLVGREPHDPTMPAVQPYMTEFWKGAFLPRQPFAALNWLVRCHVGHLLSYPLAFNGGGLLGLALCIVGAFTLFRQGQRGLLFLCLSPFALNLIAAGLRRYPYAGDQRLEQHLVPGICLLLGTGVAELGALISARVSLRKSLASAAAVLFFALGLTGAMWDARHPYHDLEAAWARDIGQHLRREVRPGDQIVSCQPEYSTLDCLRWQLLAFAEQMRCPARIDKFALEQSGGRLWLVRQVEIPTRPGRTVVALDPWELFPVAERRHWQTIAFPCFDVCLPESREELMRVALCVSIPR